MLRAVKNHGYNEKEIRGYKKNPGQFEWLQYLKDIKEITPCLVNHEKTAGMGNVKDHFLPINKPNLSSDYYILKMMTIWAAIGFTAGLRIGFNLAETGMLSSCNGSRFGALAVGALIAVGCGVLSSFIGFDIAKGIDSKSGENKIKSFIVQGGSYELMRESESALKRNIHNASSVDGLPVSDKNNVVRHQDKTELLSKTFT
ncbi:hypothetical protein [Legionella sainthelensi]|uniref:hypothetical protein n=1 Tax=Legionella sainthelensi TaxID=28087 RepID=UPI002165A045|nr:hypothetical protein [Legionella sainthelensi]